MKWQSIETAPKDRTPILAWNGKFVSEALWEPDAGDNGHVGWGYYFESDSVYSSLYDEDAQPTHWMPLPSAPRVPLAPSAAS